MLDKGYGFIRSEGQYVFCHASKLEGQVQGIIGQRVRLQVVQDLAKGADAYRALSV